MTTFAKLSFAAAEMDLALLLAKHAPNDFVGRAIARHVVVRTKDFIVLAYDALGVLKRALGAPATADVRKRLDAYRDAFDEYYARTRTKLGAHVQPLLFAERLELWTDVEVSKLSYFTDGAREVYEAFAHLSPADYAPYAEFGEATDASLLNVLADYAREGSTEDGSVRIGVDVFAASRPRTVCVLNFTDVHQRAGELAAIDEWVHGEWAMLQMVATYPNAARILRGRILTDVVSFADCLSTRLDGDPTHRYPGLDELLSNDGDPSPIIDFRTRYRFQEKIDELRFVRNRMGAHLERDPSVDMNTLLGELDSLDWSALLRFYDRLRSIYRIACRQTHFLSSYLLNGQRLDGVFSRAGGDDIVPFNAARPTEPVVSVVRSTQFDNESALDAWLAGGLDAKRARSFLWDAFMSGPPLEIVRIESAHVDRTIELRAAHLSYRTRLIAEVDDQRAARLVQLAQACARGDPAPLGAVLAGYHDSQHPREEAVLLALVNALGELPVRDAEFMRGPLRKICADNTSPALASSTIAALYKSLLHDRPSEAAGNGQGVFSEEILPLLEHLSPTVRLLVLLVIVSRFPAGVSGAYGQVREREEGEVLFATCLSLSEVLGDTPHFWVHGRALLSGRDYVGVAVLVGNELTRVLRSDAINFYAAAASDMILLSRNRETEMQSLCNRADALVELGRNGDAIEIAMHVFRADPLATELHFALMPLLVKAGVPREQVRPLLEERLAVYHDDPKLAAVIAAARNAVA